MTVRLLEFRSKIEIKIRGCASQSFASLPSDTIYLGGETVEIFVTEFHKNFHLRSL